MSSDQLIQYLTQRWLLVVTFFNELYPQVAQIIPNFYSILSQQITASNNMLQANILTFVNTQNTLIRNMFNAQIAQLNFLIQNNLGLGYSFTIEQVNNIRTFLMGRFDYLQGYTEYNIARLNALYEQLTGRLEFEINKLKGEVFERLNRLDEQVQKLIHVAHLDNLQSLQFLGYFLKSPYQVIADILLEMFFTFVLYELGKGLLDENEVEQARPEFVSVRKYPSAPGQSVPTED